MLACYRIRVAKMASKCASCAPIARHPHYFYAPVAGPYLTLKTDQERYETTFAIIATNLSQRKT
jgi:hypothetical protein